MISSPRLEQLGADISIAGALLLALSIPASRWGWVLFLCANGFWLAFALRLRYAGLIRQTLVFCATSVLGIMNSFWPGNPVQVWLQATLS